MTAESGLGYVAVTTGVGEVGTGTNAGEMTAISDACEKRTDKKCGYRDGGVRHRRRVNNDMRQ